ncbi:trichohyalin-like [Fopius arisanus]|uniref:Trichohyalin-like n=1 Tax=Fopius arisanus TaxID=64838 RepID=A0A9R1TP43_9HYME|nr:PREDICTED: trichohyalin-like [Fopius arisanus]
MVVDEHREGEGNEGYNLRKTEEKKETEKNGKEGDEQKQKAATTTRAGRGRKKINTEDKKDLGKEGSATGGKKLEDYWTEIKEGKNKLRNKEESQRESSSAQEDSEQEEEKKRSEAKLEEEMTEKEKEKRKEREIMKPTWTLPRTPDGRKDNEKRKDSTEREKGIEAEKQTQREAEKEAARKTDGKQGEERPQKKQSGDQQSEERKEEYAETKKTGPEKNEKRGEEREMGELKEWMEKWEKRQKEEWEARMADIETLIRTELGTRRDRDEEHERKREEIQERQLRDQVEKLQDKLRKSEERNDELEGGVRMWKEMAEAWRQKAEKRGEEWEGTRNRRWAEEVEENEVADKRKIQITDENSSRIKEREENNTRVTGDWGVGGKKQQAEQRRQKEREGQENQRGEEWRIRGQEGTKEPDERRRGTEGRENSISKKEERTKEGKERQVTIDKNPPPGKMTEEEWQVELDLRRSKRKNMIIEGLTLVTRTRKEELEKWMMEVLDLKVRIEKLDRREQGGWLARVEEVAHKKAIMKEKTRLKEKRWGVYITDDLTERQKEIQAWMEGEVRNWRKLQKEAWTGYNSICVEGTWLEWDEKEGILKQREKREERAREGPF